MITADRIELVTGIGVLLYRASNPDQILISREIKYKELTGKLVGEWATTGYETQEFKPDGVLESHREVIERYSSEEIRVIRGRAYIPSNLEETKLCVARISPPEMAAWIHTYHLPVSDDFEAEVGDFKDEIGEVAWASCRKLLSLKETPLQILLRPASFEILQEHIWAQKEVSRRDVQDYPDPFNLPPWRVYRLLEAGFTQDEALSQLGIDPRPLRESSALIRSL